MTTKDKKGVQFSDIPKIGQVTIERNEAWIALEKCEQQRDELQRESDQWKRQYEASLQVIDRLNAAIAAAEGRAE